MRSVFSSFIIGWVLVLLGLIVGGVIFITNLVSGFNNGWTGETIGWMVGAVIGFFVWEFAVAIFVFARLVSKERFAF